MPEKVLLQRLHLVQQVRHWLSFVTPEKQKGTVRQAALRPSFRPAVPAPHLQIFRNYFANDFHALMRPLVEESWEVTFSSDFSSGMMRPASCLPSSTPH